ncbi:MAG: phenylalanine--tRNA ligase subunit alpha [Candidatus Cloacimonetes bacterium]|nr:phenylalanine--tRNA ligase subunit alpha [Candidatus Cloacimonadota bacterium]
MKEELRKQIEAARTAINAAERQHDLMQLKSQFLGKKSDLNGFMMRLKELPASERPAFGKIVNEAKQQLEELINSRLLKVKESEYAAVLQAEHLDLTMPGKRNIRGALHPITQTWREIEDLFIRLGFQVADGPDIEDEYHNFDALNTPADHPARDLSDTFYIEGDVLLRTHTSPVQIRTMEKFAPPIKIICPGRTYRNDNDATHSPCFHQVEALVVDEGINIADLRDMLNYFARELFGPEIAVRIRPHFFPFTEPSAEMDMVCPKCMGSGCSLCKDTGWLELGGAGIVDPNVFEYVGIDSEKYTGYAFGLGIDRIAMLRFGITDMRLLFNNDLRFLRQFK